MKKTLLFSLITLGFAASLSAQCDFEVNIGPQNIMLCPNEEGQLTVSGATYDAIQWYMALNDVGQGAEPVFGETSPAFAINAGQHSGYYFWVSATIGDCTENSDTITVGSYFFNGIDVSHGGEYEFNPNTGNFNIDCGDTATLTLLPPYTEGIIWYRNNQPIAGETDSLLEITETGSYSVQGSPVQCPAYVANFGFDLNFVAQETPEAVITQSHDTLFVSSADSYQWYFEGVLLSSATDSFLVLTGDGTYVAHTSIDGGCTGISAPFVYSTTSTGNLSAVDFSVSPVPATEFIRWNSGITGPADVIITDASGRRVRMLKDNPGMIGISSLDNGIYFLTVVKNGSIQTARFIKTD